MPGKISEVATRFVDLVLQYGLWAWVETFPADKVSILSDILSSAGFDLKELVPGKLLGNSRTQEGNLTGHTYPVNVSCPFKVVDQDGVDHLFATGWLDCAVRRVIFGSRYYNESREKIISAMIEEIRRSVPLEPIQLTPAGDLLCECPPQPVFATFGYFVDHTRGGGKLDACVGVHVRCGGQMDRCKAIKTHDAIVCRKCRLRVLFSKRVKTYSDLRQALAFQRIWVPAS